MQEDQQLPKETLLPQLVFTGQAELILTDFQDFVDKMSFAFPPCPWTVLDCISLFQTTGGTDLHLSNHSLVSNLIAASVSFMMCSVSLLVISSEDTGVLEQP